MSLRCYLLSCVLLLAALPVSADTLWLDNGDRLSGKIQLASGNTLVMRTEYAGEVAVQVSHIRTLESDGPLLIKDHDNASTAAVCRPPASRGRCCWSVMRASRRRTGSASYGE